jgi:Protein of unknown function (DUF3102)
VAVLIPLDQLAEEINVRLEKADEIDGKARDHRIAAGLLLKEARERLPRGEWGKWLVAYIRRSRQDVYRCLALVKSDNPGEQQKARQREKAVNRDAVQRHRENVTYVSDKPVSPGRALAPDDPLDAIKNLAATLADPLDVIKALILDLDTAEFERCKAWFFTYVGIVVATSPQIEISKQLLTALPEAPASAPEAFNNGDQSEPPTVSADKIGIENTMPPQVEVREEHPAASQLTAIAVSEPRDDGDPPEVKTRFLDASGIGRSPAPKLACYAKGGSCRYGACARAGHCLAVPVHEEAAS